MKRGGSGACTPPEAGEKRHRTPVFQVGIHSFVEHRIVNTTVPITCHGLTGAWRRAIDFYALHKKIGPRSKAFKSLLAACPGKEDLEALFAS